MNNRTWKFLDAASLVLLIVAAFSQLDLTQLGRDTLAEGLGYATKTLKFAISDAVFALVLLYFVARCFMLKAWKRLWWPPLPCFALIFALGLSALHSPTVWDALGRESGLLTKETKEAIAEIAQWIAYFVFAPWLFVNLIFDRRGITENGTNENAEPINRTDLALRALFFAAFASGIVALIQAQTFEESAPRGLWSSPNVYGAVFAFVLPLLLEWEPENAANRTATSWRGLVLGLVALVLFALTVVSPFALAALALGLFVTAFARVGPMRVKAFRLALVAGLVFMAAMFWNAPGATRPFRAEFARVASDAAPVKKQYVEWGAAIGWSESGERIFASGLGPGNYQVNIGKFYGFLPNEEKMPPDSNNLYLVQALSIGVFGLGALVWVWLHFFGLAWRARMGWLGAGVAGALASWAFVNLFHALVVRGAGLVMALVLSLAAVAFLCNKSAREES